MPLCRGVTGLGTDPMETSLEAIADAVKTVMMQKAALQIGVSIALAVANAIPIVGQVITVVYGVVQTLVGTKYKAELQDHLAAFNAWATAQGAASDARLTGIQNAAWLKVRATAISIYTDSKAKGINSTNTLATVSPFWQDLVAKYRKPLTDPAVPGLGELFPLGRSGLAWIGDDEILVDRIQRRAYTGLAHVVDQRGTYHGTVWYDGRLLYPNKGMGDVWSNLKDTITGTYRQISSSVVSLVPKIAKILPPVLAMKYIVAPAMTEIGWGGTAQKMDHGVTAVANVAVAVGIATVSAGFVGQAAMTPVLSHGAVTALVSAQGDALIASQAIPLIKQPVTSLIAATGHDTAAADAGNFLDKAADKGIQYASDPGAAITDAHTIVDTLTGKEAVTQADAQIAQGKATLLAALAQRESEATTQLNSDAFQSTASGMLVCKMLDDPTFATQLMQLAGMQTAQAAAKSSVGTFLAAAAAAGGLFVMNR